jgi:hypothetical protein
MQGPPLEYPCVSMIHTTRQISSQPDPPLPISFTISLVKQNREPVARTHKSNILFVLTEKNINEENVDEDVEKVEELDQVQPHRPVVVAVQVVPQIPTCTPFC